MSRPKKGISSVKLGDIVLISIENTKRLNWPLGRIIKIFTGADGKERMVKVKTSKGELLRPLERLYPLEISEDLEPELYQEGTTKVRETKSIEPQESKDLDKAAETVTKRGRQIKKPIRFND